MVPYKMLAERHGNDESDMKSLLDIKDLKEYVEIARHHLRHLVFASYLERKLLTAIKAVNDYYKATKSEDPNMYIETRYIIQDLLGNIKSINGSTKYYKYSVSDRIEVGDTLKELYSVYNRTVKRKFEGK